MITASVMKGLRDEFLMALIKSRLGFLVVELS